MCQAYPQEASQRFVELIIVILFCFQFDNEGGDQMRRVCATFCQNQKAAVDMVKAREKKDSRLEKFIAVSSQCKFAGSYENIDIDMCIDSNF